MHNTETFIEYLRERVNCEFLDFKKTVYVNRLTPMTITCKLHGDFIKNVSYVKYPVGSNKIGICPKCTIIQRELDRNKTGYGTVYLIWVQSLTESFFKLGYTQHKIIKDRFADHTLPKEYSYELIRSEYYENPKKAIERELALHKEFRSYKYVPKRKFDGYDECYEVNIYDVMGMLNGI